MHTEMGDRYKSGLKNAIADCLSRFFNSKEKEGSILQNDIYLTKLYYSPVKCKEVAKESSRDPVLSKIIRYSVGPKIILTSNILRFVIKSMD